VSSTASFHRRGRRVGREDGGRRHRERLQHVRRTVAVAVLQCDDEVRLLVQVLELELPALVGLRAVVGAFGEGQGRHRVGGGISVDVEPAHARILVGVDDAPRQAAPVDDRAGRKGEGDRLVERDVVVVSQGVVECEDVGSVVPERLGKGDLHRASAPVQIEAAVERRRDRQGAGE
jgi:hypothetical protein